MSRQKKRHWCEHVMLTCQSVFCEKNCSMRARVFLDNPLATIEAVRMLVRYTEGKSEVIAVPARAVRRASRLLKMMARYKGEQGITWVRSREWRERLELAGLDSETLEVVDQGRWDRAWEQLSRTRTFRDDVARRQIALGVEARERAGSYIRAVQLPEKKRRNRPE